MCLPCTSSAQRQDGLCCSSQTHKLAHFHNQALKALALVRLNRDEDAEAVIAELRKLKTVPPNSNQVCTHDNAMPPARVQLPPNRVVLCMSKHYFTNTLTLTLTHTNTHMYTHSLT